ncbi:MAG: hypothetical protein LBE13_11335 [Bacteroidales bacterium]|jgi:hypothetical protein|nr:hypothetical protein [Bacteroidales bacterium]
MNAIKIYYFVMHIVCCILKHYDGSGFTVIHQTKKKNAIYGNIQKFFILLDVQNMRFAHSENKANIFKDVMEINCNISMHYVE